MEPTPQPASPNPHSPSEDAPIDTNHANEHDPELLIAQRNQEALLRRLEKASLERLLEWTPY